MSIETAVQLHTVSAEHPSAAAIARWVRVALEQVGRPAGEVTVRVVDEQEMMELNRRFRGKDAATNVLSFPFQDPPGVRTDILGDVVVCAPVVAREAARFAVEPRVRWAHMVVHGVLHLCGYDHLGRAEARTMERVETVILARLGLPDPYRSEAALAR